MPAPRDILMAHQRLLLTRYRDLGAGYESLSAWITAHDDHGVGASAIAQWTRCQARAPLGLFGGLLAHLGDDRAPELLDLYARDYGCRVVRDDLLEGGSGSLTDTMLGLSASVGRCSAEVQHALADDEIDTRERGRIALAFEEIIDEAQRGLARLRSQQ